MRMLRAALAALLLSLLAGCGYNEIQSRDEARGEGWLEVVQDRLRMSAVEKTRVIEALEAAGRIEPGRWTVAVPVFRNLTYRAAAEGEFAEAVVQALLRHGVRVRGAEVADYLVSGEIISLADLGEAYSASDKAVLYRAEVEVALTIRNRHTSEIVVQERLRRRISYPAQSQRALQPSVDSAARQELAEQVAQTVLVRLLTIVCYAAMFFAVPLAGWVTALTVSGLPSTVRRAPIAGR